MARTECSFVDGGGLETNASTSARVDVLHTSENPLGHIVPVSGHQQDNRLQSATITYFLLPLGPIPMLMRTCAVCVGPQELHSTRYPYLGLALASMHACAIEHVVIQVGAF